MPGIPRKTMIRLTEKALEIVGRAVKAGFPAYAKRVSPQHLLVDTGTGKRQIYAVKILYNPLTGEPEYLALALGYDYGEAPLARIKLTGESGFEVLEEYPWNVPRAIAYDPLMLPQFRADVWARRLEEYFKGELSPRDTINGYRILVSRRGDCVALENEGEVHAWVNLVLGKIESSVEWIARWEGHGSEWVEEKRRVVEALAGRLVAEGLQLL